ncbi:MAG: hypothetical protein HUU21_31835 [Polyangiaceae bacterium]|nr:hypothetical protein [Polyangiaceae bacterium]
MKPGDHPEFFRMAAPPGASRESSIVLDREGRFWHEGERVENQSLERAMRTWIARHPDSGRLILTNGYDWCYFKAEGAPFVVESVRIEERERAVDVGDGGDGGGANAPKVTLMLFDGSVEPLDPSALSVTPDGAVYARVKGGAFEARFSRHAQAELGPLLASAEPPVLQIAGVLYSLAPRAEAPAQ